MHEKARNDLGITDDFDVMAMITIKSKDQRKIYLLIFRKENIHATENL